MTTKDSSSKNTSRLIFRGSGTYEHNGVIYSSLVGYVHKTNKLLSVKPIKSRYKAKVGDIIVGRVEEVSRGISKLFPY